MKLVSMNYKQQGTPGELSWELQVAPDDEFDSTASDITSVTFEVQVPGALETGMVSLKAMKVSGDTITGSMKVNDRDLSALSAPSTSVGGPTITSITFKHDGDPLVVPTSITLNPEESGKITPGTKSDKLIFRNRLTGAVFIQYSGFHAFPYYRAEVYVGTTAPQYSWAGILNPKVLLQEDVDKLFEARDPSEITGHYGPEDGTVYVLGEKVISTGDGAPNETVQPIDDGNLYLFRDTVSRRWVETIAVTDILAGERLTGVRATLGLLPAEIDTKYSDLYSLISNSNKPFRTDWSSMDVEDYLHYSAATPSYERLLNAIADSYQWDVGVVEGEFTNIQIKQIYL